MNPAVLCFDVGTSACKAALLRADGFCIRKRRVEYNVVTGSGGRVEQAPEALWQGVARAAREATAGAEPEAISFSSQMCSHMLVDRDGEPLTPFLTWADTRAGAESVEFEATFPADERERLLGCRLPSGPAWALPKLKWLARNEPAILGRARFWVQPKDWLIWKMTGRWASDASSLRGLIHQDTGDCPATLMDWASASREMIPPIAAPDAIAGELTAAASADCGLPAGIPIVVGWNDLAAGALGCAGDGFDISGTSEHLGIRFSKRNPITPGAGISSVPLDQEMQLNYGVTSSGGRALQWCVENLRGERGDEGYARVFAVVRKVGAGADGVLFLPYLLGERSPWWNPRARGVFFGLGMGHDQSHLARAVVEGVAFALRSISQRLGARPEAYAVAGGGSCWDQWNQIKADVLQTPFVAMENAEAGCAGAGVLAAVALGWHSSREAAVNAMIRSGKAFEPNSALRARYDESFALFERLYHALEELFQK
jgi:sugar (pentulose or hexulose) kinase